MPIAAPAPMFAGAVQPETIVRSAAALREMADTLVRAVVSDLATPFPMPAALMTPERAALWVTVQQAESANTKRRNRNTRRSAPARTLAPEAAFQRLIEREFRPAKESSSATSPETVTLPPSAWRVAVAGEIRRAFGLQHLHLPEAAYSLPDTLWPAVGEMAWRDPAFAYAVAAHIEAGLYPSAIMGGENRMPAFHPATFWLLLVWALNRGEGAGAASRSRRTGNTPARLSPAQRLTIETITRAGERIAFAPGVGWAMAWDQWLLLETARRLPLAERGDSRSLRLRNALAALPLRALYPADDARLRRLGNPLPDADLIAHSGWAAGLPGWLRAYVGRSR